MKYLISWTITTAIVFVLYIAYQISLPLNQVSGSFTSGELPTLPLYNARIIKQNIPLSSNVISTIRIRYDADTTNGASLLTLNLQGTESRSFIFTPNEVTSNQPPPLLKQPEGQQWNAKHWLTIPVSPPLTLNNDKMLSLSITSSSPKTKTTYIPYDEQAHSDSRVKLEYAKNQRSGNIGIITLSPTSYFQRFHHKIITSNKIYFLLIIAIISSAFFILLQYLIRWKRYRDFLPIPPFLLLIILSLLYSLPLFTNGSLWGRWDWPEAAIHYATARHSLAQNEFPLWTPLMCGGAPLWENPQAYWPSLTFLFTLIAGDVTGTKLAIVAYSLIGLFGMHRLGRHLNINSYFAILPAVVFMFSGFMSSHLAAGQMLWLTTAWIPWVIYYFIKSYNKPAYIVPSVVFYLLIFLEGRVYINAYLAVTIFLIATSFAIYSRKIKLSLIRLTQFSSLFLLLGAIKILPVLSFLKSLPTNAALPKEEGIALSRMAEVFLTRSAALNYKPGWAELSWHEYAAYVGIIPLTLSAIGFWVAWRRKNIPLITIFFVGIIFLLFSTISATNPVYDSTPIIQYLHNPGRAILLTIFSISLGAGFGAQFIASKIKSANKRIVFAIVISSIVAIDLIAISHTPFNNIYSEPPIEFVNDSGFRQSSGHPDNGYHYILTSVGAKDYCPTYLRESNNPADIFVASDEHYTGEIYSAEGKSEINNYSVLSNSIFVQLGNITGADKIVINQRFSPNWTSPDKAIEKHQDKPAIAVTPKDSGKTLTIRYRPQSFLIGSITSVTTIILLISFFIRRKFTKTT